MSGISASVVQCWFTLTFMSLLDPRITYAPFEYEKAHEYWQLQEKSHWLPYEINMSSDLADWKGNLSDAERGTIGHILKTFTSTEVFIAEYWSQQVAKWFKKPEIQMMAACFSAYESIHAISYAYLDQTLGLEDYAGFLAEPAGKAKIDRLMDTRGRDKTSIARSLAIFSAFNEGVNLFSSFAILLNFSRFNKLKGVGQIIGYSIRDEALHAEAGCWLFRTFFNEYPEIWTDELKKDIYNAARLTIELEDAYIEQAFSFGAIEGVTAEDMKAFIRQRANTKLQDLGLKSNWKNVDKEALRRMSWFDQMSGSSVNHDDFFASRVTDYAKGNIDFSKVWGD